MNGIALLLVLMMIAGTGCATLAPPQQPHSDNGPPQEAEIALPVTHTVEPGETLVGLAIRYYGQQQASRGVRLILDANPHIQTGSHPMRPLVLTIPPLSDE